MGLPTSKKRHVAPVWKIPQNPAGVAATLRPAYTSAMTAPVWRRRDSVRPRSGRGPKRPIVAALAAAAGFGATAIVSPAQAQYADESGAIWWVVGGAGIAALLGLFSLMLLVFRLVGQHRRLRASTAERLSIDAALRAGRAGTMTWSPRDGAPGAGASSDVTRSEGEPVPSPNLGQVIGTLRSGPISFQDVIGAMDAKGGASLAEAVRHLRETGAGFNLTLRGADGRRYFQAVGTSAGPEGNRLRVLWLQDATERIGGLLHLEKENRRLRGILDSIPVPVWSRDADLRLIDCNESYFAAVEAPDRDTAIDEGRELAEGEAAATARTLAERALDSGAAQTATEHFVVAGERRLFELGERPLPDGTHTAGYAIDRTEREQIQRELDRLIRAHDDVLERLATAITVFGPDRRLQFFNGAYAKMWNLDDFWLESGPDMLELLDLLRERRMLPETGDFSAFKNEWLGWFTSLIEPREELMHLPNGTALWMVISPHPLGGLLMTFEDVTDKLTLERSYNTLIDVQRTTLDNLYEGVAVFGEDGCVRLSNPVLRNMWEMSETDLDGGPHLRDLLEKWQAQIDHGGDWEAYRDEFMARVSGRMTRTGRITRTDGRVLAYGVVPLPDGGALISFRDITDTIRVERALRERNDALEAADRLKSEFVANISYELRTPLNTIIGFTEILHNQYFGQLNERQVEYTEGILEASNRLLALINDILDLAVIEAGRMMLEIDELAVSDLVTSVVELTTEWAREQELKLEAHVPDDVGTIEGDERRLKHALFNLVSNSIKFTPPGGKIVLSAMRDGDNVRLTVQDNGIGIPAADQERVFEKFVRGKAPDNRSVGVGLGLSLVKNFIQLHGGTMTLASAPDQGTSVTCVLPAKSARPEDTDDGAESQAAE